MAILLMWLLRSSLGVDNLSHKDLHTLFVPISVSPSIHIPPPHISFSLTFNLIFNRIFCEQSQTIGFYSGTLAYLPLRLFLPHKVKEQMYFLAALPSVRNSLYHCPLEPPLRGCQGAIVYFCLKPHFTLSHLWLRPRLFSPSSVAQKEPTLRP